MLGERFRAYFSDFDHRHKLRASAGDRERYGPAQYAARGGGLGAKPQIFCQRPPEKTTVVELLVKA